MRTSVRSRHFGVTLGPVSMIVLSPVLLLYAIVAPFVWLYREWKKAESTHRGVTI